MSSHHDASTSMIPLKKEYEVVSASVDATKLTLPIVARISTPQDTLPSARTPEEEYKVVLDLVKHHALRHRLLLSNAHPNAIGQITGSVAYHIVVDEACIKCSSGHVLYETSKLIPGLTGRKGTEMLTTTWSYATSCICPKVHCGEKWKVCPALSDLG